MGRVSSDGGFIVGIIFFSLKCRYMGIKDSGDINLGGRDLVKVWIDEDIKQYIKDNK